MACYTLSECVLEHLDEGRQYTSALLNIFAQENNYKIAIDAEEMIRTKYRLIAENQTDDGLRSAIISWMYLMTTFKPQKWEYFDVVDKKNDIFLEVCCQTIDKALIVSSENKCKWKNGISTDRLYSYNGTDIKILNKDDAIKELQETNTVKVISENINRNENLNK